MSHMMRCDHFVGSQTFDGSRIHFYGSHHEP